MKASDVSELKAKMASLPPEMDESNQVLFAEFGQDCAKKYVPQLLKDAGLHRDPPNFDIKTCESCYWSQQTLRIGCGFCSDFSEHIDRLSPKAAQRAAEYAKKIR